MKRLIGYIILCLLPLVPVCAQPELLQPPATEIDQAIKDLRMKTDVWERADAANRLGALKDAKAFAPLVEVMLKDAPEVVRACADALQKLGDRRAVPALLQVLPKYPTRDDALGSVINALTFFGDPSMKDAMLDIAGRPEVNASIRSQAITALESLHDRTIGDKVLRLLDPQVAGNQVVAARAALLAGRLGVPGAAPKIIPLLQSDRALCRLSAAQALELLKDPVAIEPLTQVLGDTEPTIRLATIDALAAYRQPALLVCYGLALRDGNPVIRAHGATAMGTCGNAKATPLLLAALRDPAAGVRAAAAEGLGPYAKVAQPEVVKLLADPSPDTRAAAVQALGAMGDPASAPALVKLLIDPDPAMSLAATTALGRLDAVAANAITPLLLDASPILRARAAEALGRMKATGVLPALIRLAAADPAPEVRQWAVFALGEMPEPPADAIGKALQDPEPAVRTTAIRVIGARRLITFTRGLLAALDSGSLDERNAAHTVLVILAGQDLGFTPKEWEPWVAKVGNGK